MRRDMELIRTLLLRLEAMPLRGGEMAFIDISNEIFQIDGHSQDDVYKHMELIVERGLTEPRDGHGMTSFAFRSLSWEGYDFLDSIRDPKIWKQTKGAAAAAGAFTMDLLISLAKSLAKAELQKHTGLSL